jgi:hypothetical protein
MRKLIMSIATPSVAGEPRQPERPQIPPLRNGDRLTRAEFERRYAAMPGIKKAELVEGVVYMPSPVGTDEHAVPHADLITWLGFYRTLLDAILHPQRKKDMDVRKYKRHKPNSQSACRSRKPR